MFMIKWMTISLSLGSDAATSSLAKPPHRLLSFPRKLKIMPSFPRKRESSVVYDIARIVRDSNHLLLPERNRHYMQILTF